MIEDGLDIFTSNEGTMLFKSPEMVDAKKSKDGYSGKSFDIWGMGISFYCFTYLKLPYFKSNINELINKIKSAE